MRPESPESEQYIGGDWAKRITRIYVIVSAFQSWPFAVCSQAAHYGCGCWAENACNMNPYSTAVSTSGITTTLSNVLTVVSFSVQLWILLFLFRFPNQSETDTRCEPLIYPWWNELQKAWEFFLMDNRSCQVILIIHLLGLLTHESPGFVSQLRARCIEKPFGFAAAFDMGHLLQIRWKKYVF